MTWSVLAVIPGSAVASYALTRWVRRYALTKSMLDIPTTRSSHAVPTPRGGGLAIAAVTLLTIGASGLLGLLAPELTIALLGGGIIVAGIGWLDDRYGIDPLGRASSHAAAAAWTVYWLGGLPEVSLGGLTLRMGAGGAVLAVGGIVWAINAYNFMDGTDGLAASEAFVVSVIGGALLLAAGDGGLGLVAFAVAGASAGFLLWNWEPARIFMGDSGSGFLGFCFASIGLSSERAGSVPLIVWVMLLGAFVFDATATLLRRMARGERWYQAHRSHAYQRIVQAGWSHGRVAYALLGINLVLGILAWLGWKFEALVPWALLVGALGLAAAYAWVERRCPMRRWV